MFWSLLLWAATGQSAGGRNALDAIVERAGNLERTHTLLVAVDGETVVARGFRGHDVDTTANIKSLSKTWMATLVGAAIDRGMIESVDQPIGELLGPRMPHGADERVARITVGQLLSMQSGLERTSGANYGSWVASRDWVANALQRPFVAEPGTRMLYSTGNTHVLSAILTRASGRSTLALMRDWLGKPLGIDIPPWTRDPQGIYFGGNEMGMTPHALLVFGEMIRRGGRVGEQQVISRDWIESSWRGRTRSIYTGDAYGYGWFTTDLAGVTAHYGRGYGGQVLFVVPERQMTVVMTSDPTPPSDGRYFGRQAEIVEALIEAD
ncbi:serine hydrolase domain-containing protein [Salinisphaera shabanensis]|uniref:serine hydrolase domain-containing protein n=1 Tax=Salinisphaera shabanensis TaxID=180542 RepID=UPI000A0383EE|nr:serine hydrolase [Salinisphaera shabanensis]